MYMSHVSFESERDAASNKHYHKVLLNTHVANKNHVLLSRVTKVIRLCDTRLAVHSQVVDLLQRI